MRVRFQADADFNQRIVLAVRRLESSLDFQAAHFARLRTLDDREVLSFAASEGRVLVSHDLTTIPDHFAKFVEANASAGVLIIRQRVSIRHALEEILRVWTETEVEEWINQIRII
jgi:hypothetical protein